LSRQKELSGVGKKGCILGSDGDWNYFYSGIKGLNMSGLSWVNSYLYDSFTIAFFIEKNPGTPLTKCVFFKGLRAGWANMNMVQKGHIKDGLHRYEKDLRAIIESESLPPAEEIRKAVSAIDRLSETDLKIAAGKYFKSLAARFGDVEVASGATLSEFIEDGEYLSRLRKEEMRAILVLEYMKFILGKDRIIDIEKLIAVKQTGSREVTR